MTKPPMLTGRYSSVAIAFHWIIAALVVFNLIVGIFHDGVPALRALMPAHKAVGITVLVLTLGRVAWRLGHRPPPLPSSVAGWEKGAAYAMHATLYALLLILPLTGWAMVSAGTRHPLAWFGLFPIPYLPVSDAVGKTAHGGHEVLGWMMAVLVALHVAAALRHHLLLRDATLVRMAPVVGNRRTG